MSLRLQHAPLLTFSLGLASLIFTSPAAGDQALMRVAVESNVNQQYLVESVSIAGVEVDRFHDAKLSSGLRRRLAGLVGAPCDMSAIGDLATRLRSTLRLQDVRQHLSRGSAPDRVRVDFEVVQRDYAFDLSVPRFLYQSAQGWTAELDASAHLRQHTISAGLGSNGDDLTERFTGFSARYDNSRFLNDKIRVSVGVEGWHDQWNAATRTALANETASGASSQLALYRARTNIAPVVTFALTRDLSLSIGASFEGMQMEAASPAENEMSKNANAMTADVVFGRTEEGDLYQQRWDARYGVRFATRDLGSDYVYTRQLVSLRYERRSGRHILSDRLTAGTITGNAPLFERFTLGNSSTLRGWDHYVIDPLGGNRMAHNSVSYGYQFQQGTAEVFYDAGFIGNGDRLSTVRHSLGVGFRQGIFNLAMAFPVNEGRIEPVFIAGMNY